MLSRSTATRSFPINNELDKLQLTEDEIGEYFELHPRALASPEQRPWVPPEINGVEPIEEDEPDTQQLIREVCDEYRDFLLEKNEQYGDSAVNPVRIFSKASPVEQLLVRIDDKLSRLVRGNDSIEMDEDIMDDLVGYWLLLKVARRRAANADD